MWDFGWSLLAYFGLLQAGVKEASANHRALVVGENLGTVPEDFTEAMSRHGILGMNVLWFEQEGGGFRPPETYRRLALATVTTHDLPPTAGYLAGEHVELRDRLGLLTEPVDPRMWLCTLGTSLSFCVYGVSLARAYGRGDMSIVYPLVRGTGPVMTVLFAHLFLGERLNLFGYMGILFIVSGAVGLTWPRYDPHSEVDRATFRRRQLAVHVPADRSASEP